jgi:predicted RNA binding protein YcfA (HicA-like mRNA interferase family)
MGRGRGVPSLKLRSIIKALTAAGFVCLRTKGSHSFFHHPECRRLTVSLHPSKEAGPPIVRKIIRDAGLTDQQFLDFL